MRIKMILSGIVIMLLFGCRPAAETAVSTEPPIRPTPTTLSPTEPLPTEPLPTVTPPATVNPSSTPSPVPPTPTVTAAPPAPSPTPGIPSLTLVEFVAGFDNPVYLIAPPGGADARLFVVERHGTIRTIENGEILPHPFLDITPLVGSGGQEQGLLSMAFHPNFPADPRVFVDYTNSDGDTVIAGYRLTENGESLDPASAQILLIFDQPYPNHNGGQLQFGPDGNLYIGTGDGGAANDPHGNGQKLSSLLGKMLRISVDFGEPYTVPADNPFIGTPNARPEVWAYGLRNPWRFSFDRETGDLWIADVGQNKFEEVDFMPAETGSGANYGWNIMEGQHCFQKKDCQTDGLVLPIAEYSHSDGCSITGGYVYRGAELPGLRGVYLYGDFCSGKIWGIRPGESPQLLLDTGANISSFGEDAAGELYVLDLKGSVFQVASDE